MGDDTADDKVTAESLGVGWLIQAHNPRWEKLSARHPLPGRGKELAVSVAIDGHVSVALIDRFGAGVYLVEGDHIRASHVLTLLSALSVR